jgi:hypothetical protein
MSQSPAYTKFASHPPRSSTSSTDLNFSYKKTADDNPSSQATAPSSKIRAQIPIGPSNLTEYLRQDGESERIALGLATHRSGSSMASKLATWDAHWRAMGGK